MEGKGSCLTLISNIFFTLEFRFSTILAAYFAVLVHRIFSVSSRSFTIFVWYSLPCSSEKCFLYLLGLVCAQLNQRWTWPLPSPPLKCVASTFTNCPTFKQTNRKRGCFFFPNNIFHSGPSPCHGPSVELHYPPVCPLLRLQTPLSSGYEHFVPVRPQSAKKKKKAKSLEAENTYTMSESSQCWTKNKIRRLR